MAIRVNDEIMGFVEFQGDEFPFYFDRNRFSLVLLPPSMEKKSKLDNPIDFFDGLLKSSGKTEWVKAELLEGNTSDNDKIIFEVQDSPKKNHGFFCYEVNWFFICNEKYSSDKISGFRISGRVVDCFYPPQQFLQHEIERGDDKRLRKISVSTRNISTRKTCGEYSVRRGLHASIELHSTQSIHPDSSSNPIDATSYMSFIFSKEASIKDLIITYSQVISFFRYVTYRNNVGIDAADVFFMTEDALRDFAGKLVIRPNGLSEEKSEEVVKRVIGYDILGEKIADILKIIKMGKIGFARNCDSIDSRRSYNVARIILIMAEFEREFRNIHGIDAGRSSEYSKTKQDIISLIDDYRSKLSGKEKEYAKEILRVLNNHDNSYATNVENALRWSKDIMARFISVNYHEGFDEVVASISKRAGEIRNGFAHSKLDFEIEAIHLNDIKVIEELTYVIRLKQLGIADEKIVEGIKKLFKEPI